MPETPDFDRIARELCRLELEIPPGNGAPLANDAWARRVQHDLAEALRQMWNARGAADIGKLEAELTSMMGVTAAGPYVKNLDRALRSLDR